MTTPADVAPLLAEYLPRQRWFAGDREVASTQLRTAEVVRDGDPLLLWLVVDVHLAGAAEPASYQVVVGGRSAVDPPEFLHGKERVIIGEVDGTVLYDALVDPELALDVLHVVAPDEEVDVARPLVVEQSNSSVIFDERLILKLFRRVHPEPNPDVEIIRVLHERGFPHVVPQVASLRRDGVDLAVVRHYYAGAVDAWQVGHTSLRDMLASRLPPEECGADFGADAHRLGEVTATLHLALAEAYGTGRATVDEWVDRFQVQLQRVDPSLGDGGVAAWFERTRAVASAGASVRVHGDLHLGQCIQTDEGWFVLDFEGEPARPVRERTQPTSSLKDVAGMLRSFHYAARTALAEWGHDVDDELAALADAWEQRARGCYLEGYNGIDGIDALLPPDVDDRATLLGAFELDKAVYEVGYERSHRPDWVEIPLAAIDRMLSSAP